MMHNDNGRAERETAVAMSRVQELKGPEGVPLLGLKALLDTAGNELDFSFYQFGQGLGNAPRRLLRVPGGAQGIESAHGLLSQAMEGEELAIHSRVVAADKEAHIPMLALVCERLGADELRRLRRCLGPAAMESMTFYFSGRSFHAYGDKLLDFEALGTFWDSALRANEAGKAPLVDESWVARGKSEGYGSLRLSARGGSALCAPRLLWGLGSA